MTTKSIPLSEVLDRIVITTDQLHAFWSKAHGWAPKEAAELLERSRLDRYAALSRCLRQWCRRHDPACSDGALILAWANLGTLVEGTLKLFLAIYFKDYSNDSTAPRRKDGKLIPPDELTLEQLRQYLTRKQLLSSKWRCFVETVQSRRNSIHFFKTRDIGTFSEFKKYLLSYSRFLRDIHNQLPYPDDCYRHEP